MWCSTLIDASLLLLATLPVSGPRHKMRLYTQHIRDFQAEWNFGHAALNVNDVLDSAVGQLLKE